MQSNESLEFDDFDFETDIQILIFEILSHMNEHMPISTFTHICF